PGKAGAQLKAVLQEPHPGRIKSLTFTGDGKLLASGHENGSVRLWEVSEGKRRAVLEGHAGAIAALRFTPGNRSLIARGQDHVLRSWDVARRWEAFAIPTTSEGLTALTADGRLLAVGEQRGTIKLLDMTTGRDQPIQPMTFPGANVLTFAGGD